MHYITIGNSNAVLELLIALSVTVITQVRSKGRIEP